MPPTFSGVPSINSSIVEQQLTLGKPFSHFLNHFLTSRYSAALNQTLVVPTSMREETFPDGLDACVWISTVDAFLNNSTSVDKPSIWLV
jgi:hypothetical protein